MDPAAQPGVGLSPPPSPGVCSVAARWLGCPGGRAAGSSHCLASSQPWVAASPALCHRPCWLCKRLSPYCCDPPMAFITPSVVLWECFALHPTRSPRVSSAEAG